jgi:hypothetical protein
MSLSSNIESIARAEDTTNLLDHIAWTDTIKPALLKHRAAFESQLVGAVLGNRPVTISGQVVTAEQIAGRIDGITYSIKLLEDILRNGERALEALNAAGLALPK